VADALSRIRGAFALIIHDAAEERVIAARDREVRFVCGSGDSQRQQVQLCARAWGHDDLICESYPLHGRTAAPANAATRAH